MRHVNTLIIRTFYKKVKNLDGLVGMDDLGVGHFNDFFDDGFWNLFVRDQR